jgi:hypothetical protein
LDCYLFINRCIGKDGFEILSIRNSKNSNNSLLITPRHPIRLDCKWICPIDISNEEDSITVFETFNFVGIILSYFQLSEFLSTLSSSTIFFLNR